MLVCHLVYTYKRESLSYLSIVFALKLNTDTQLNGWSPPKQSDQTRNGSLTHQQRQIDQNTTSTALASKQDRQHGIVPLPSFTIGGWIPVSSTDLHDYEELTSQRNSVNEQQLDVRLPIIRTMSTSAGNELMPKFDGHRARNNSMPIFTRIERRPAVDHDYDEPIRFCNLKKPPVYQNECMARINARKKAMLRKGQRPPAKPIRPIIIVTRPQKEKKKTKDYEVPVVRADSATESTGSVLQPSQSPGCLRLNKAKSLRVVKQERQLETKMCRSGSVGMESKIRDQLQARKHLSKINTDQDDMV